MYAHLHMYTCTVYWIEQLNWVWPDTDSRFHFSDRKWRIRKTSENVIWGHQSLEASWNGTDFRLLITKRNDGSGESSGVVIWVQLWGLMTQKLSLHPVKKTTQEGYSGSVECPFCNPVPRQRALLLLHWKIPGRHGHAWWDTSPNCCAALHEASFFCQSPAMSCLSGASW